MRIGLAICAFVSITAQQPASNSNPPSFRLYFLGHEIGREDDTNVAAGLQCAVHFEDRGTAIDLQGTFEPSTSHLIVKGRNRDTAWFSMLDTEWPARKAAFERWLAPDNFDAEGRQKMSLNALNSLAAC